MKVLLVEDDKNTLLLLRLLLTRAGCDVIGATDAASGIEALKEAHFDWLIVDGQLPPTDGFELSTQAKAVQPDIGIVMISGVFGPEDILGRPIQRVFPKPVDTDALFSYMKAGGLR